MRTIEADGTIPGWLDRWARERPDRLFVWCGDDRLTFDEALRRASCVASGLRALGVAPGERIAIICPNRIEMVELFLACPLIGAVQVPLNVYLKGEFLRHQLSDCQPSTLIADEAGLAAAGDMLRALGDLRRIVLLDGSEPPRRLPGTVRISRYADLRASPDDLERVVVKPDDLLSIVYTSGTTGSAKGCMLSHGYYARVASVPDRMVGLGSRDVIMTALPAFHGAARMMGLGAALREGISLVLEPAMRSTLLERATETGATVLLGVAAVADLLLAQPPAAQDRAHQVRVAIWVPANPEVAKRIHDRFGFPVVSEAYGQTECACATSCTPSEPAQPGSAGRVAPQLEMKLVDDDDREVAVGQVGEILFRPRSRNDMFQGYWRRPEDTLRAFRGLWYHTGDYGRLAEDGSMFFVDRKKDCMRRRGENISSIEVETAIRRHPKVADVAVHAVPSPISEDDVKACLVVLDGQSVEPAELFEFFGKNLPYFAIPRYVEVLGQLPKNAMNRVMKHVLRDRGVTPQTWDFDALGLVVQRSQRRR